MADHLLQLIKEVAGAIKGVSGEVADMKNELEEIQVFIQDADRMPEVKEDKSEEIKKRMMLLREAVFQMEDVIDEYQIHEEQQSGNPGCAILACEPVMFFKTKFSLLRLWQKIQDIKSSVLQIKEINSSHYDSKFKSSMVQESSSSRENQSFRLQSLPEAPLYMKEDGIVGLDDPENELVRYLVEGRVERTVICVVGMGGLGKTTLAKKVFDNKMVIQHFYYDVWITVSQSYTVEDLLRDLLIKFCIKEKLHPPRGIFAWDRRLLIGEVRTYLHQKRYVIFFDDVWDTHFWDRIEFAVPDYKNGSRIFITTRNMEVAMSCKKYSLIHIYKLQSLPAEECWVLFCKKAFPFYGICPPALEDISRDIVKKCMGIPLVIVTVAGVLSTKEKNERQFLRFSRKLISEFEGNPFLSDATKIISFCYDDLPYYLKSCFLYFGMYPDDLEVESKRLIWQWIAEGFVKYEEGKTLEEVAEQYLYELIDRSLVIGSSFTTDGKVKGCHVHDLVRYVILEKCNDLTFCRYISEDIDQSDLSATIRRLSVATIANDLMRSMDRSPVRSLLFFTDEELPEYFVRKIPTKYRLLRVLDFENAQLYEVPENLGYLFHLKYLSFRNTGVESLPNSIGMLQNLETLDLRQTRVHEMPKEISKLRKLRHLLADYMSLISLRGCIGGMKSLQTLDEVEIDHDEVELITELEKLLQLRKLRLTNICSRYEGYEVESLHIQKGGFENLKELQLGFMYNLSSISFDEGALHSLNKLVLKNIPQLKTVPSGIHHLENLKVLYIQDMPVELEKAIVDDATLQKLLVKNLQK